jgi:GntR family transcriptional regulator
MIVSVNRDSVEPPNEQLTRQFTRLIAAGQLERGARLPTVRQLASDLGVAPNTVARCYNDLELCGLIVTNGRHGTSVASGPDQAKARLRDELLRAAQSFVELARSSGASGEETLRAVRSAIADPAT